ncbi:hypothetical protein [Mesoflavibacter zeaxanthinifaciens]|uniref:hypothetical protein n=1 Tax=Mesoflavibacter zeaxanthinifaciens TaxID=393060 RepID=UPI003A946F17
MNKAIQRKDLYDLVWKTPLTQLAPKFNLNTSLLKKVCSENNIPLPQTGYWSKLKHNVQVEILELPNSSDNYAIDFESNSIDKQDSPQAKLNKLKRQLLNNPNLNFNVPERLSKPDFLTTTALKGMQDYQKGKYFIKGDIVSTMENQISISVAKEQIPRSLRFMDTLIKLVKKRGHSIEVDRTTKFVVNNQKIEVRFREIMKREQHPEYSWITKMPSGILSFRFDSGSNTEWRDSLIRPLETRMIDILAKLELVSQDMIEYQIELEKGWEEQRIKRKIEEEKTAKRNKEISDFKSLINSSGRWNKSESLRNFLDAFEIKAKANGKLDNYTIEWLKWAHKKADWYDPFIEAEDDIFLGIDRDAF